MCLSIPSQVVRIEQDTAWVDTLGMQRHASLALMGEEVAVGDYVLIHVGFVMNKMDAEDAAQSLELYQQMLQQLDAPS
ncbi:HypC/HybG/HupF family hydrogenase formation chaperone [Thiomicrospira microaerophila]|uniref:HypC/HybG/HupF family hydrogenase formation chaperone n=1 Tax=Thiomicrospira microaerophila TaxID=406020 RepID=UPI0020105326|nr:HypC/HybG/HupF family hydrogenase formation chaperone [Thiomicrospira microaerophila]UQB42506.1 HypC/HybG/HupF family hydrogenase formation chaperone [Thiomicrospira microaerophila]